MLAACLFPVDVKPSFAVMDRQTKKPLTHRPEVHPREDVGRGGPDAGLSGEWPLDRPTETSVIHDEKTAVQSDSGATSGKKSSPDRDL